MPEIDHTLNDKANVDNHSAMTASTNGAELTTSSGNTPQTVESSQTPASDGSTVTYTDAKADVSLVSLGGRVFKVQSFVLKAQSTFLLVKLGDEAYQGEPILIPAHSRVLKAWLDLAHLHNRPPTWIWKMSDPFFKLCDYLGSRGVAERALLHANSEVERDPWALFVLASQKNNIGLAKSALRFLATLQEAGHKVITVSTITPAVAAGVALPYLLGLYGAALAAKTKPLDHHAFGQGGSIHGFGLATPAGSLQGNINENDIGWKVIAANFHPITG